MNVNKEFFIKNRFWLMLGAAGVLWLPIFFVSCAGLSQGKPEKEFKKKTEDTGKLARFHNEKQLEKLDEGKAKAEKYTVEAWEKEWARQQDRDGSYWNLGSNGIYWFDAINTWKLPIKADQDKEVLGPDGAIAKIKAGDMTADFGLAVLKTWPKGFYDAEIDEVSALLAPAYAKNRKDVVVCTEYDNIKDDKEEKETTKEEAWALQEDLVVRRELLRLLRGVSQETHRFKSVGMFHKVPFAKPADSYESAEWRLELLGGSTPGAGGGKASASGLEAGTGQTISLSFNASSRLINIRPDQKPASLANMRLRFWQRALKGEPKDVSFPLKHEGKVAHKGDVDLKSLGLVNGISLKGFSADRPIEISLVPADFMSSGSGETSIRAALSNANWRLDLVLDKRDDTWYVSPQSRLTNIQPARRKLLVYSMKISIGDAEHGDPQVIELQGEPIGWSSSRFLKELGVAQPVKVETPLPDNPDFDHDVVVRQVATWDSNPVKRVDYIGVGINSHMTNNADLTTYKDRPINEIGKMKDKKSSSKAPTNDPDAVDDDEALIIPYWRLEHRRYLVSTNQVRVLPVAIQMIVDQGQMEEVLTALEPMNSRLNFTKTAVNWKHVPAVPPEGAKESASIPKNPGFPGGGSGLPFTPRSSHGSSSSQPAAGPDRADAAMVELTVYGIVKIFEPPGKKAAPSKGSKS